MSCIYLANIHHWFIFLCKEDSPKARRKIESDLVIDQMHKISTLHLIPLNLWDIENMMIVDYNRPMNDLRFPILDSLKSSRW